MMKRKLACIIGLGAAVLAVAAWRTLAGGDPPDAGQDVKPATFKPKWEVGQKWVVETVNTQLQAEHKADKGKPVKWQFEVQGVEPVDGKDCYKVQIKCLVDDRTQPVTTVWSDTQTMMMKQFQTQLPVQGEFRKVTETYKASGTPAPVMAPLSVLPLEMPVFLDQAGTKALEPQKFSYEVISGASGSKAVGDVGFAYEIEQGCTAATVQDAKDAKLADDFSKDLDKTPLMKVSIKGPSRKVEELWQPNKPWPVYSRSGGTEARLVEAPAPSPK